MGDIRHAVEAVSAFSLAWAANSWASVYPLVTGLTAALALFYMVYQVFRLLWRWANGFPNFLSDQELKQLRRESDVADDC